MEVLLLEDVAKLGKRGEVITVKEGYARNFLVPKKLAIRVNPTSKKMLDNERKKIEIQNRKRLSRQQELAAKLGTMELQFVARANDGVLYGSVSIPDLVKKLADSGFELEPRQILLEDHIKTVGTHSIPIRLKEGIQANITVHVVAEE
ncbi:MAG: 50S ribosomal protein L9 [Candidatus Brocadiia bacterium]